MTVTFQNAVGTYRDKVELEVKGNFLDREAEITWRGQRVAHIDRKFLNYGQILFDNQTYYLTVAPGGTFYFPYRVEYLGVNKPY